MTPPASSAPPALRADRLSIQLGGRRVLHDVSLEVAPGEVVGLFGPSGAGKSTLFRVLAGELTPASGGVHLAGGDVSALPLWQRARRGLGHLPQTPSLLWDLTVLENLKVFHAFSRPEPPLDVGAIAANVGLGERLSVVAGALSGGERRRLELARVLLGRPRVLLCDEPFAAIDPQGTSMVAATLRQLATSGGAILLADHHASDTLAICDRAALLLEGSLAVLATPAVFRGDPLVRKHYAALG